MKLVPRRALLGAALVFAVAGCTHHTPHRDTGEITVTRGNCGPAWHVPGGTATFQIRNAGTVTTDVELVDPTSGGIYAEVDALAPGTSRPMRVLLGRGQYAFRCLGDETDSVTGPVVRVADGPAHGAPAIQPVTEQDLAGAVRQYRSYVSTGLGRLDANVAALRRAVHAGDLAGARAAWLTAHLAYERLGAAYGTFGDFADAIDGRPDGLPGGVRDPGFTGFHRIEYGLWHAESAAALSRSVDRLATDVAALRKNFSKEQTDPHDLPLRAHEIMENALQFELSGAADQGSGTSLATASANLDGTTAVLSALDSVLRPRYPGLAGVTAWVDRTRALLDAHSRTPVAALSGVDRERLDGAVGQLLEVLAPIAAIAEVRRGS